MYASVCGRVSIRFDTICNWNHPIKAFGMPSSMPNADSLRYHFNKIQWTGHLEFIQMYI